MAVSNYVLARLFIMFGNFEGSDNLPLRYASFMVENIISMADADIASGSTQLRLRFGHDSGLMPLLAFLDVNGFGRRTASAKEGIEIFPAYNIPMGCSVQFVFFRNATGNVIFKLLLNEAEATLPLHAVSGPYYRWADFKEHYLPLIAAAKESILRELENPLETLKAVDGRFPGQAEGMTIDEMQVLCQSLGLYEALNLDGGGSTTLWVKGEGVLNHPYDNKVFDSLGERIVPNIITVR